METTAIQKQTASIQIGQTDAPVKVVEYINLRCPDSKHYEETVATALAPYIARGQVVRYLKHFDKHKGVLERGQWAFNYVPVASANTYQWVKYFFNHQAEWGALETPDAIGAYAEDLGLTQSPLAPTWQATLAAEVSAVGVTRIPTVFVNGTPLIEKITQAELLSAVEQTLNKE